jgi:hypothetical protein
VKREAILAFLRTALDKPMPEEARLGSDCNECSGRWLARNGCPFLVYLHAALGLDAAGAKTGGA